MLRNSFKATLRNLWKHRAFGFLNIAGLAIGIACAGFILLWVEDEVTYDHNLANRQLHVPDHADRKERPWLRHLQHPRRTGHAVKAEIPGIQNSGRISWRMDELAVVGDKKIKTSGHYADPSILSMYTVNFIKGEAATALGKPQSIVISQSLARACFGNEDPIGKTINMNAGQASLRRRPLLRHRRLRRPSRQLQLSFSMALALHHLGSGEHLAKRLDESNGRNLCADRPLPPPAPPLKNN